MAHKINPAPAPDAAAGADDLDVLHPEREVRVAGRTLTVREYGFVEGLQVQRRAAPILAALIAAARSDGERGFDEILRVLEDHPDELVDLVAQAADVDAEFVRGLSDAEGQHLMLVWWAVNGGFFMRRVVRRLAIQAAQAQASARAGATSTPASSPTVTPGATLAATPGAN